MSKKLFVFLCAFAVALTQGGYTAHAQTTNVSDIVARMNAIVQEMEALSREFRDLSASLGQSGATVPTTSGSAAPAGAVLGAATSNLQEALVFGETNDTIEKLQRLLTTDPEIYDHPYVTGYFGEKTKEAIARLQERFGLTPAIGVVGPGTAELILGYFLMYPDGTYPAGVLDKRPIPTSSVQGATVSTPTPTPTPAPTPAPTPTAVSTPLKEIFVRKDDGEIVVRVVYKNGDAVGLIAESAKEDDVIEAIVDKTGLSEAQITAVLDLDNITSRNDYDDDDAEDMLDDAEQAIDDAKEAIEEADDDGEDVDEAEDLLEEAEDLFEEAEEDFDDEDYDKAYEKAKDARSLAEDAEDAIGEESDRQKAKDAIDDAEQAIDDAKEAIEEADDDGEDVDEAEDLLEEAEDLLEEAEEAYDDEDYDEAIDLAEEAEDTAKDAEDEL